MQYYKYIIISDLHGWSEFDEENCLFLDSRMLGEITSDKDIHAAFLDGGIDKAVENLRHYACETLIGFSIGGTIAWRAAIAGLKCKKLIALSATRLRFEEEKPSCDIRLIYGADDPFRPKKEWFVEMGLNFKEVAGEGHDLYKNANFLRDEI